MAARARPAAGDGGQRRRGQPAARHRRRVRRARRCSARATAPRPRAAPSARWRCTGCWRAASSASTPSPARCALDFERGDGLLLTLPDAATAAQAEAAVAWLQQRRRDRRMGRRRAPAPDRARPRRGRRRAARRLPAQRAHRQHARVDAAAARPRAAPGRALPVPARGRVDRRRARSRRCASPRPTSRRGEATFDAVVVCAALESARLLAPLGVKLPWKPIRGYSVTVAQHVREAAPDSGPRAALLDVRSGISISRLGARVRVAGGHEAVPRPAATPRRPPRRRARPLQPLYDAVDERLPRRRQLAAGAGLAGHARRAGRRAAGRRRQRRAGRLARRGPCASRLGAEPGQRRPAVHADCRRAGAGRGRPPSPRNDCASLAVSMTRPAACSNAPTTSPCSTMRRRGASSSARRGRACPRTR